MIQAIVKGVGGTIFTEFVGQRPASCTVSIFDGDGTEKVAGATCTADSVNTTATAAADQGDTTITVASATGIRGGRRYLFGNEEVGVKSVASLVATLWAPLSRDHANGTTFQGLRWSYDVSALVAADAWADGYAVFTPATGAPQTEALHCTLHKIPDVMISEYDTRRIIPNSENALSASLDLDMAYQDARDNFLIDLGGKAIVHAFIGVAQWRWLVSMRFWLDRALEFGSAWATDMTAFEKEYFRRIEKVAAVSPVDEDGDGATISGPEKHAITGLDLETL